MRHRRFIRSAARRAPHPTPAARHRRFHLPSRAPLPGSTNARARRRRLRGTPFVVDNSDMPAASDASSSAGGHPPFSHRLAACAAFPGVLSTFQRAYEIARALFGSRRCQRGGSWRWRQTAVPRSRCTRHTSTTLRLLTRPVSMLSLSLAVSRGVREPQALRLARSWHGAAAGPRLVPRRVSLPRSFLSLSSQFLSPLARARARALLQPTLPPSRTTIAPRITARTRGSAVASRRVRSRELSLWRTLLSPLCRCRCRRCCAAAVAVTLCAARALHVSEVSRGRHSE